MSEKVLGKCFDVYSRVPCPECGKPMEIASNVNFDYVTRRTQETLVMNFCEACRVSVPIKKEQYSKKIP